MDSQTIVTKWLADFAYSVSTRDLDAHMELVSEKVAVLGLPNAEKIDYAGWMRRRRNEFNKKLLQRLTHSQPTVINSRSAFITFRVQEMLKDQKKNSIEVDKEITLHHEEDGKWRVIREQIFGVAAQPA